MRRGRVVVAAVVLVLASILVARCDTRAQFAPSLDRVVGLQVADDRLTIVTGPLCRGVDRIVIVFGGNRDGKIPRTQLTSVSPTTVGRVVVGAEASAPGLTTSEPLPADFDWRDYTTIDIGFSGPDGELGGATSVLEPVTKAGAKHEGDGTAYVRGEGWLTPAQIAAGDAKDFLTACTPDPAKKPG